MSGFVVYRAGSGEIAQYGDLSPFFVPSGSTLVEDELAILMDLGSNDRVLLVSDLPARPFAYYVDLGTLALNERQPFPFTINTTEIIADGLDTATISGVPAGTSVRWPDGQNDEVTDGVVELSVDLPGTYTLRFTAVAYLDQEVTIEAVAAA